MKKLFVVLAILFIGILLAGCTSQPPAPVVTPTPTPVPTTVPEVRWLLCHRCRRSTILGTRNSTQGSET